MYTNLRLHRQTAAGIAEHEPRGSGWKAALAIAVGLVVGLTIAAVLVAAGVLPSPLENQTVVSPVPSNPDPQNEGRLAAHHLASPPAEHGPDALLRPLKPRGAEGALAYEPMSRPVDRSPSISTDGGLRVVALCDPAFRYHHKDWRGVAASRLRGAADILWPEVRVDLVEAVPAQEWDPGSEASSIVGLLNGLSVVAGDALKTTGARFVVGMAYRERPDVNGLCGLSRVLTDHCVVLETSAVPELLHHVTIAHEVAHCFGAFHSAEPDSVMIPRLVREIPTHFDAANRRLLELTRSANLSEGELALSEDTLLEIAEITRASNAPGEHNGAADLLARRAYRALQRNAFSEGERLCRLALEYEPALSDTRANLAYALLRQGKREAAQTALREALAGDPELRQQPSIKELSDALQLEAPAG